MIISHNNPKLAPLNQDDFKMKIVEDLGIVFPSDTSIKKTRCAIFQCNKCNITLKRNVRAIKHRGQEFCYSCARTKHGLSSHKLYTSWSLQRERCYNTKGKDYSSYGARGIITHEIFNDFLVWLHYVESLPNAYKENYTIDRVNNDANYEPMNLRWASKSLQVQNTRLLSKRNTSGYRGVSFDDVRNKWSSRIVSNSMSLFLGRFNTAIEAAQAFDNHVVKHHLNHTINFT
jgi:hypothetical protein